MAFTDEVKKSVNQIYIDVYLKRRFPDGTFDADWTDITRWVKTDSIGRMNYKLDSGDYEVGSFVVNNVGITFDNSTGKFNDNSDSRSLWAAFQSRHLSKIKIDAGYITDDDEKSEATPFNGLLDEKSLNFSDKDIAKATILSLESVLKNAYVVPGTLSSAISASEAIYILCNRGDITDFIGVSAANINPAYDATLDDPNEYDGKKLDAVINEIMLFTNSIMHVDGIGDLIVRGRNNTLAVKRTFYSNSDTGKRDDIYRITNFNSGRQRVKNTWFWGSLSAVSDDHQLKRFGVTRKSISTDVITTTSTKQAVIDELLDEFQFPKREVTFETDYMSGVLTFFDTVVLDVKPRLTRESDVPISGHAIAGTATSIDYMNGIYIDSLLGFKVISISHDLKSGKTIFKVREKGTTLTDGYLHMILSKTYAVSFAGTSSEDIDVSLEGIDARRAKVEVLDVSEDYATDFIKITRPNANTIRLTAGGNITDTFRVLVVEVEA